MAALTMAIWRMSAGFGLGFVWRDMASCLLGCVSNVGLDAALFFTDFQCLKLSVF